MKYCMFIMRYTLIETWGALQRRTFTFCSGVLVTSIAGHLACGIHIALLW